MSDASAPGRVARLTLWISSTATRPARVSAQTPQTASTMSVRFARRMTGSPRNRANSIAIIFAVAAGGTVM
jgi:hypothetical protein